MKKKTLKKWSNRLMKASVEICESDTKKQKIDYISSKQLKRMISSRAFREYFKKYKGITFHDVDYYLIHNEGNESDETYGPVFDEGTHNYILKDIIGIFNYTLIIDNPSIEYLHIIKNRKFYIRLGYVFRTAEIVMV